MGYGLLRQEDVEVGRKYLVPIDMGAKSSSPILVTKIIAINPDGFVYQTLDGKTQGADSYDRPKGIILKGQNGKIDFLMGESLLEQIVQADKH